MATIRINPTNQWQGELISYFTKTNFQTFLTMYNTIIPRKFANYRTHLQVRRNMHTHTVAGLDLLYKNEKEGNSSELGLVSTCSTHAPNMQHDFTRGKVGRIG